LRLLRGQWSAANRSSNEQDANHDEDDKESSDGTYAGHFRSPCYAFVRLHQTGPRWFA